MLNAPVQTLLAAIVDSSDDGIISKTLQGIITSWNRSAERIFGYTPEEVVGQHISILFPPERLPEEEHFLREIAAGRRVEHFETERRRKDGQPIQVAVTLSPVRDERGEIVGISTIVRDISEKTQLERKAARAAAELDRVLSRIGEGVVALDADLRYVFVNDAAVQMIGMAREAILGRTLHELFPHETMLEAWPHMLTALTASDVVRFEGRNRSADRWYENRLYPSSEGLWIFFSDITERKRFEEALAAARDAADADAERLNLALAAARLGDWTWDAVTDVVTLSKQAAEIFGVEPGPRMTWEALRELLHPDDRERVRAAVADAVARRTDYDAEYRIVSRGRERWVSASGRPRYDEAGRPLGMLGVLRDLTRDRLLVRLDDTVRPLTDPEEITFNAARLLGERLNADRSAYAAVEADEDEFTVTGNYVRGVHSMVGRYRFRQFGADCVRSMRAGQPWIVSDCENDARLDREDRDAYRLTAIRAMIAVPILKSGRLVAAMAVQARTPRVWADAEIELVQHVASRCWESIERARVERERASLLEAAEAANRAKDEFMAMLGHELRNPLSPILTALQLMKLRGSPGTERERTVIERQVSHLTRLVDDLLDVSRIARGKVELKTELIEMAEVVARAIEVASPMLEERMHTLVIEVPRSGLVVDGDAARLSQVVSNLLTNAAKYTPHGGRISIAAARENDDAVLRVRDSGIGIAPDVLPRVFDLFVQGRQAIDRAQGGLGLGLTIVKNLVERHGGQVVARSNGPGLGSEFIVHLPIVEAAPGTRAASAPAVVREAASAGGSRILVVDDNEDAAEMVAMALQFKGFETRVAHDGPEALRVAADFRPDAAFLDLGLPVMDGYELASRLKELPGLQHMRLIAVTGYGQESDRQRTSAAGFYHHVVKPVDLDLLVTLVTTREERSHAT